MKFSLGIVAKGILNKINTHFRIKNGFIQLKNSYEVANWFKDLKIKKS